jgi:Tol biopolymer transport system component
MASRKAMFALPMCVAFVLAAFGCGSGSTVDHGGSLVSTEGRIAFIRATSFVAPNFESEVYAINVDGTQEKRLKNSPGLDAFPSWLPGGKRVAFVTDRDGNWEIYTMNPDGTDQRRLTNTPEDESSPTYSPDGQKIAYVTEPVGTNPEISVMSADGSGRKRLASGNWPSWSPDGERVSYTAYGNGANIHVMNADGSDLTQLTDDPADDSFPAWRP